MPYYIRGAIHTLLDTANWINIHTKMQAFRKIPLAPAHIFPWTRTTCFTRQTVWRHQRCLQHLVAARTGLSLLSNWVPRSRFCCCCFETEISRIAPDLKNMGDAGLDGICCWRSNAKTVLYLICGHSCIVLDQVSRSFDVFNCNSSVRSTSSGLISKARSSLLGSALTLKYSCSRWRWLTKRGHQSFKGRLLFKHFM